ncbi:MAG: hypothetical protein IKO93_16315, partial [Lentisphaeria bacterium]|nr:hypothetical protein [Lentisphaeria bacterium]
ALDIGDWRHNSNYQYKGSGVTNAVKRGENFFVVEFYAGATVQQPAGAKPQLWKLVLTKISNTCVISLAAPLKPVLYTHPDNMLKEEKRHEQKTGD